MTALRVVLVGAGRIALGAGLADGHALSHAEGAAASGAEVAAAVDPDPERRAAAEAQGIPAFETLAAVPGGGDIVVLCTPSTQRLQAVRDALRRKPAAIVIEKPLAPTLAEAAAIVAVADCPLFVNYNRRTDPRLAALRTRAGSYRTGSLYYGRGAAHYASHAIDLVQHWFGPAEEVRWLPGAEDAGAADPSLSFQMLCAGGFVFTAIGQDGLDYDLFDLDFVGPGGRLTLHAGGARIVAGRPEEGRYYRGYRHLAVAEEGEAPVAGFAELYTGLADWLSRGTAFPACTGEQALRTAGVLAALERSRDLDGRPVAPAEMIREAVSGVQSIEGESA